MINNATIRKLNFAVDSDRPFFTLAKEQQEQELATTLDGILMRTITPYTSPDGDGKAVLFKYTEAGGDSYFRRINFGSIEANINTWTLAFKRPQPNPET